MRRDVSTGIKFALIFVLGGFFVWYFSGGWPAQAHVTASILPFHNGNLAVNADWQYINCEQGSSSGNDYLVLKKSTSTLMSPGINLTAVAEAKVNFKARTYNGTSSNSNLIIVSASADAGSTWAQISSSSPVNSVLSAQPEINLSGYAGQTILIKLETPGATGSKGVGIDEISITGKSANIAPLAGLKASETSTTLGNPIFFDGSDSTDTDGFIISYFWNFGDGGSLNLATTSYNYVSAGNFTATLTVADDDGATSSADIIITVVSSTPPETTSTPTSTPAIATTTAAGNIVINEFLSDPGDGDKEWLELYDKTASSVDLAGWTFADNAATTTLSGIIGTTTADKYFIVEFNSGRLNNAGDIITIRDAGNKLIDQVAYGNYNDGDVADNAPWPNKGYSSARKTDGLDSGNNKSDFAETITPTKGSSNIITPRQNSGGSGGGGYTQPPISQPATAATNTIDYPPIASGTKIVINEIFPNPAGPDEENEFIELKNIGNIDADLAGWSISDATDKKYVLDKNKLNTAVKAGGFLSVSRKLSGIALNNTGNESVRLFTPTGAAWDQVQYLGKDTENKSYSRDGDGEWFWTASSTPGAENIFDLPTEIIATSTKVLGIKIISSSSDNKIVLISEIFPNPDSKNALKEFIELYNPDNEPTDLAGFAISDAGNRTYTFKNKIIEPQGYLAIFQTESKISLNNDGDNLTLKNSAGQTVAQLSYQKAPQDYSLALSSNGKYQWTGIITPGQANKFSVPPAKETAAGSKKTANKNIIISAPLSSIRDYDDGQKVKTTGTVSVEPGILGANIFYLAGSGIQVYCYKKDFPALKIGDIIEVTGELAQSGGERRLKITDRSAIKIIGQGSPPMPHLVTANDIGENYEGSLVTVKGQAVEIKGRYLYLDDGSDEARIYLKESINNQDLNIKDADWLEVTGIVSQTSGGYRLLPRSASDIVVKASSSASSIDPAVPVKNSFSLNYYLIAIIVFLIAIIGIVSFRFYKNRRNSEENKK